MELGAATLNLPLLRLPPEDPARPPLLVIGIAAEAPALAHMSPLALPMLIIATLMPCSPHQPVTSTVPNSTEPPPSQRAWEVVTGWPRAAASAGRSRALVKMER